MSFTDIPASRRSKATRSSLACLACRSRHLKCDGRQPQCTRCVEFAKECHYAQSRRGGTTRSKITQRQIQRPIVLDDLPVATNPPVPFADERSQGQNQTQDQHQSYSYLDVDCSEGLPGGLLSSTIETNSPGDFNTQDYNVENDGLIKAYYQDFHRFHPMVLPQRHLISVCKDEAQRSRYLPLVAILRLIGHIYDRRAWSALLQESLEACFAQATPADPVMVQCRLLYSMLLFWHDEKIKSQSEMSLAIKLSLDVRMYRQEFAADNGHGDPVLVECWRRTWWTIFIVDAYYAGTLGSRNFELADVEATVDLPCSEAQYETGEIPCAKSLQDFDNREFFPEIEFSSFAYLIGAVRCAATAITARPKTASTADSKTLTQAAEAMIDGWLLLLPKDRKQIMSRSGDIDELMFQAHLVIHVALVGLHRPFSDLRFNPVENHSSCAREPRPDMAISDHINVHTVRVLRSVKTQVRVIALSSQPFNHTPFTTCMVSEGALALLSACNFLLEGKDLLMARDQIRVIIGCLTALGEIWPRTARNVKEIQYIARHVFGLHTKENHSNNVVARSEQVISSSSSENTQQGSWSELETSSSDAYPYMNAIGDLCGWFDSDDTSRELLWWPSG